LTLRKKYHPAWTRRKALSQKINKWQILYEPAKFFYRCYCNFTSGARATPSFYLIGMSASGTSSFFMNLVKHPKVYSPVKKETRFFNHNFEKGFDWYKANFPLRFLMKSNQITGEGTAAYMDYSFVPERIRNFTPNAKMIVLMRNPIERAFSIYHKRVDKGLEKLSFEDAINSEFEIIKKYSNKNEVENYVFRDLIKEENQCMYLRRNIYVVKFERWFKVFTNPDQFLILENEELKKFPQDTYNKSFKYLGVEKFEIKNLATFNVQNKKSVMNKSTRKLLQEFFRPYNERLFKLLGKNFDWN